jgi:hypothetical protein
MTLNGGGTVLIIDRGYAYTDLGYGGLVCVRSAKKRTQARL